MTKLQVFWARRHDWFLDCEIEDNGTYTIFTKFECDEIGEREFTDFDELKAWAGY